MDEHVESARRRRLGDFEIVRELGRGGMGIVYEARQRSLNRPVALKVLSTGLGMTSKAVIRFRREAETAAKLHHTNIVPIHATGEEDGTHYYAMELVDGPSLNLVIRSLRRQREAGASGLQGAVAPPDATDATVVIAPKSGVHRASRDDVAIAIPDWVARTMTLEPGSHPRSSGTTVGEGSSTISHGQSFFDTVARMIADVADALDYAHSQNVVHRDMKPSNLLLSPDGRLSINDFGLARMLEQPGMTTTGEFMGSPLYMSPEQITAGRAPLDHRTDIYSLGATLYELLTLQPPFPGERRDQIIGQIMHKEPAPPRSVNKKIPVDLETICLKAMEKDPDRRYQTGADMAADLRRFVNRFAISAKRAGVVGRSVKWVRRHPTVAVLLALVVVTGGAAGLFAYSSHQANLRMVALERDSAKEKAILSAMSGDFDAAERAIQEAEVHGASAGWVRMLRGQVALHGNQPSAAVEHLEQAVRLLPDNVAAKGMLCLAVNDDGRWDNAILMVDELESLTPKTPEDYVFLGWALSTIAGSRSGLNLLDEAVRMRPGSPMVRVVRANIHASYAFEFTDMEFIEKAIADAQTAKGMLPGSVAAIQANHYAHLVALNLYEETRENAKRTQTLAALEAANDELARFKGLPGPHFLRAKYFEHFGRDQEALSEWREAATGPYTNDTSLREYAFSLYRNGESSEALHMADRLCEGARTGHGELTRAMILLLIGEPDAPDKALEAYRRAMKSDKSSLIRIWLQVIPLLAGQPQLAHDAHRGIDTAMEKLPTDRGLWYQGLLDHICHKNTADEVIALSGDSKFSQCEMYFPLGVVSLADGDRTQAMKHFQSGVDTRVFDFWDFEWSRMFLEKLQQNPTWPPWIPGRQRADTQRMPAPRAEPEEGP